jgi:multiple sugar transport system permease protein
LVLAAVALPVELLLGLALACLFLGRMPGKAIFVSLLAVPAFAAPIVAGSAWRILFDNDYGPVNQILGWVVGAAVVTLWTEDADFVYPAILIADVWQWTPFMFVLLSAALSNVDRGQLEAAAIDDAGSWRTLLSVVLPAIGPAVAIAVLIRGLDLLRLFDVVWALTRGGPEAQTETISVLAYNRLIDGSEPTGIAAMAFVAIAAVTLGGTLFLAGLERQR